jgi:hypothetical protein
MDGGGRELGEIVRLRRAEIALRRHVQAHGLADRRAEALGQPVAAGAVVLVVAEGIVGRLQEVADVVQKRGDDEAVVGAFGFGQRGGL